MSDGSLLRRIRQSHGLTLREVGRRIGYSQQYVGDIERGDRRGNYDYVAAFADGMGVRRDWLLVRMGHLPKRVTDKNPTAPQVEYALDILTGDRLIPEEEVESLE